MRRIVLVADLYQIEGNSIMKQFYWYVLVSVSTKGSRQLLSVIRTGASQSQYHVFVIFHKIEFFFSWLLN